MKKNTRKTISFEHSFFSAHLRRSRLHFHSFYQCLAIHSVSSEKPCNLTLSAENWLHSAVGHLWMWTWFHTRLFNNLKQKKTKWFEIKPYHILCQQIHIRRIWFCFFSWFTCWIWFASLWGKLRAVHFHLAWFRR